MSIYPPPQQDLPIFDSDSFITNDSNLTLAIADLRYLKFPYAQGTETFSNIITTGQTQIQQNYLIGGGDGTNNNNTTFNNNSTTYSSSVINNCFFGKDAGILLTTGSNNSGFGHNNCLHNLTTGGNNTAVGTNTLPQITTTSNCTAIGYNAGQNSTGSNNTFLGALSNFSSSSAISNSTAVGYNSKITSNRTIVLGTVLETVVIPNQISYTYTSLPTYATGTLGYTISGNFSYNAGTGDISIISVAIGTYIFSFNVQYSGVLPSTYYLMTSKTSGNWGFTQLTSSTYSCSTSYTEAISVANANYYLRLPPLSASPVSTNFYFTATRIA